MSRFTITKEYKEIFEVTYREYSNFGEEMKSENKITFASKEDADEWINNNHNYYVSEYLKITNLMDN